MHFTLKKKNIILCVCGGIAAYKSVELLRFLIKKGAHVKILMTKSAMAFVGPLTFEALSGQTVCHDLFQEKNDGAINHIEWAKHADAVIIAPATANIIGKLANGIADDAITTFMLAVTSPIIICPSMNSDMFLSKPVQRNLERLEQDGYYALTPGEGELACGISGPGRLPEPIEIIDRLISHLTPDDLKGKTVLVTAGPTQEAIDPVRFISNPSSGKMGYAFARAAENRGANVILVSGPTNLEEPLNILIEKVRSASEMADMVFKHYQKADIIIKTAAVSDYRPQTQAPHKIKKDKGEMILSLEMNQDILKELGRRKKEQILIGFAAETRDLAKNAGEKLKEKNLDIIVANLIGQPDSGFESDTNKVSLFYRDGSKDSLALMEKQRLANLILDKAVKLCQEKSK